MPDEHVRELERALRSLAPSIHMPPAPDLASKVTAELRGGADPRVRRWKLALAGAAAVVVVVAALLVFSPTTREAVADFLGIGGVTVTYDDDLRLPETPSPLDLGAEVSLAEARELAPFEVAVPELLGEPDRVYFDERFAGGAVSLLYETRPGLPHTRATGAGALLTQFGTPLDESLVKKLVDTGVPLRSVRVGGAPGYWIGGEHALFLRDEDGEVHHESPRLAGNTLLWERDSITFRLETGLSRVRALEIGASVR